MFFALQWLILAKVYNVSLKIKISMKTNFIAKNLLGLVFIFTFLLGSSAFAGTTPSLADKASDKQERKMEKLQKFLNSKFGQWLVKTALKKAEKKADREEAKMEKAKEQGKTYRVKEKKQTMLGTLGLVGVILLAVGFVFIILGLLSWTLWILSFLGGLMLLTGLILLIIELVG